MNKAPDGIDARVAAGYQQLNVSDRAPMQIHGYSERGLVNALFESIAASPDPAGIMAELLGFRVLFENRYSVTHLGPLAPVRDVTVFIEPSLSEFGNPDAIVFVDYLAGSREAFFVEAKLTGFLQSSPPWPALPGEPTEPALQWLETEDPHDPISRLAEKYRHNESTILHELYLKACFAEVLRSPDGDEALKNGVRVYADDHSGRKIGKDKMVLALKSELAQCRCARFVALTTDRPGPRDAGPREWQTGLAIARSIEAISQINWRHANVDPLFRNRNPRGGWCEMTDLLSWHDVRTIAQRHGLTRLSAELVRNDCKLSFPSLFPEPAFFSDPLFPDPATPDEALARLSALETLEKWLDDHAHGASRSESRREGARRTLYIGRRAFVTVDLCWALEGPRFGFYLVQESARSAAGQIARGIPVEELALRSGAGHEWLKAALDAHVSPATPTR